MSQDPNALVWIDLEMTGLDPDTDLIIEIATIVTDARLNILAEGPVLAIHQSNEVLNGMDSWNTRTHGKTGLTERVKESTITAAEAEAQTIEFISQYCVRNKSPLCGNTICQDRRFMYRYMPKLEQWVHYRNLDVSVLKELAKRWRPEVLEGLEKKNTHKALDDIRESIEELRHYREVFLKLD
jgi:oligoribonuclease